MEEKNTDLNPRKKFQLMLTRQKEQIAMALPKHMNADLMIRVALTAASREPKLLLCTPASLIGCVIECSQLGVTPDGILGQAYLIPFKVKQVLTCQLIIGYRGLVDLAFRSGRVKQLYAEAVYKTDEFGVVKGLNANLTHVPNPKAPQKTKKDITHFYAVIHYTNGGYAFEVMTVKDVNLVRSRSAGKSNKVWDDYYEEMGKKTVLRKLLKMAPLSPEIITAVGLGDQIEMGKSQMASANVADNPEFSDDYKAEVVDQETVVVDDKAEGKKDDNAKAGADSVDKTENQLSIDTEDK